MTKQTHCHFCDKKVGSLEARRIKCPMGPKRWCGTIVIACATCTTHEKPMPMKALSLQQPFAWLISERIKTIETRSWHTNHRGPLLICASKTWHEDYSPNDTAFYGVPVGVAMAVADVVDCRPMTKADEIRACCDLYRGAWAWPLENIQPIKPFPVKGQLRLFDVTPRFPLEPINQSINQFN